VEEFDRERTLFWSTLDIYNDENVPTSNLFYTTYRVRIDKMFSPVSHNPFSILVNVFSDGLANLDDNTSWFGKKVSDMTWKEQREIYDYLQEWDYVTLERIGPEDSEWFATERLTRAK
jgi:hypothetical protein